MRFDDAFHDELAHLGLDKEAILKELALMGAMGLGAVSPSTASAKPAHTAVQKATKATHLSKIMKAPPKIKDPPGMLDHVASNVKSLTKNWGRGPGDVGVKFTGTF